MTELSAHEELRLADAQSVLFRLIALDRVWTSVGGRPQLIADDVDLLTSVVAEMRELVGRAVEAAYDVATLAEKAQPPSEVTDLALLEPDVRNVFQQLLNKDGGVLGIAQQAYNALRNASESDVADLDRKLEVLHHGGHLETDLSRRFMCGLAKALMAAGGITVWVPPHAHAAASVAAGVAIYGANKCWELEPA